MKNDILFFGALAVGAYFLSRRTAGASSTPPTQSPGTVSSMPLISIPTWESNAWTTKADPSSASYDPTFKLNPSFIPTVQDLTDTHTSYFNNEIYSYFMHWGAFPQGTVYRQDDSIFVAGMPDTSAESYQAWQQLSAKLRNGEV